MSEASPFIGVFDWKTFFATGDTGSGTPGATWRNGAGAPSNGLGINGDYYLNDTNGDVYRREGGTYSVVANIKGEDGADGAAPDLSAIAEDVLPDVASTRDVGSAAKPFAEGHFDAVYVDGSPVGGGIGVDGWVADANTWSYSSADAPSFVASVNADMSGVLSPGMRVKLTQTTPKYFIVTKVGAFGGGATLITLYGGTDYTLANAAITAPKYSPVKAPLGFPLDPNKWTQESLPITNHGYYPGTELSSSFQPFTDENSPHATFALAIPLGAWRVSWVASFSINGPTGACDANVTLSSALDSESEPRLSWYGQADATVIAFSLSAFAQVDLALAAKTTYTLLGKVFDGNTTSLGLQNNDYQQAYIRAVSAYL